jgi:predicted PurR-regulated permease PerM
LTLLKLLVSIIIAAILLLNAAGLNRALIWFVCHLSPSQGEEFLKLATITIRSVTRGIIGVAIIQTIMVGLGLILARIPAADLLTLLSLFLSIIQIGPVLIILLTLIFA